jgi:hypothetical protein
MLFRGRPRARGLPASASPQVCVGIGWRVQSEILPLQWSQVDRRSQTLPLEPGQTRNAEGRSLPYALLPELADSIEEHPQDLAPDDEIAPLFTRKIARDGGGIGAAEIRDRVGPISWPM